MGWKTPPPSRDSRGFTFLEVFPTVLLEGSWNLGTTYLLSPTTQE